VETGLKELPEGQLNRTDVETDARSWEVVATNKFMW